MSTHGKLVLDPIPTESLDFADWFENQSRKANKCNLKVKNEADKTETVSFLALFLLAWRWNPKTEIWSAADADISPIIGQLSADAIIQESSLLVSDLKISPFSPDFSPLFLEKNLAHFCSGNFAGHAPGRSGNFDVHYLICFQQGTHMFSARPAL